MGDFTPKHSGPVMIAGETIVFKGKDDYCSTVTVTQPFAEERSKSNYISCSLKREYMQRPLEFSITIEEAVVLKTMIGQAVGNPAAETSSEEEEEPAPKMSRSTMLKRAAASKPAATAYVKEAPPPRKKRVAAAKKGK
jgi:hypothetical protein